MPGWNYDGIGSAQGHLGSVADWVTVARCLSIGKIHIKRWREECERERKEKSMLDKKLAKINAAMPSAATDQGQMSKYKTQRDQVLHQISSLKMESCERLNQGLAAS